MRNQAKRNRGYGLWVHIAAAAISVVLGLSSSYAQEGPFSNAESAIKVATQMLDEGGIEATDDEVLRDIRDILNTIINDFPASDIAVKILFQDTINGLDVAALDRRLLEVTDPDIDTEMPISGADTANADDNMTVDTETTIVDEEPTADVDDAELAKSETLNEAQVIQPVFTAARFDPSLFNADVMEMAEELHYCYIRGSLEGGSERQAVVFTVAGNGQLDGEPKVKNAADLTGSAQRTYLNALIAIESCGPYPPRFTDRSYEAEFDGLGLTSLVYVNTVKASWTAASKASFAALKLDRKAIAEIQARLNLIEFDPNGIDGVVGRGTRKAISRWQESRGIPVTGFLDQPQYSALREQSEGVFLVWAEVPDNKKLLERAATVPKRTTPRTTTRRNGTRVGRYYRGRDGCLRTKPDNRRGSILLGRSTHCNLRALGLK